MNRGTTRTFIVGLLVAAFLAVGLALFNKPGKAHADFGIAAGVPGPLNMGMRLWIEQDVSNGGFNNVLGANQHILGVFLISTTASANCDFYDSTTAGGTTIAELAEGTNNEMNMIWFPYPIKLQNGLSVGMEDATCGAYYL